MTTVAAVITPDTTSHVPSVKWAAMATGDTITAYAVPEQGALAGAIQLTGTWGGATVALKASNDGTNLFAMKDLNGNTISATADAYFEFTTSAMYIVPAISGGTGDAVDAIVVLRG